MTNALDLSKLSHAEKDALIVALLRQLAAAEARIAALEARLAELTRPAKTPDIRPGRLLRGRSQIVPPPISRPARAAPGWAGRCIRTPIAWSKPG